MLQEEIALEWMVMMSSLVNYFENIPSVFAKCIIKHLLFTIKPMGTHSNDEVFKSHSQYNEHMVPSKKVLFLQLKTIKRCCPCNPIKTKKALMKNTE